MKNLPIVFKFFLILGLFAIFSVVVTVYSAATMRSIDASYSGLLNEESEASLSLARANRYLQTIRAAIGDIIMATDRQVLKTSHEEFETARTRFIEMMDNAIKAMPAETDVVAIKADVLRLVDSTCTPLVDAGMASIDPLVNQKLQMQFFQKCQPDMVTMAGNITSTIKRVFGKATNESDRLTATTSSTVLIMVSSILASLLVICALGYAIIRSSVVQPIRQLAATMGVLAKGDLSAMVNGADRRDEVGVMAKAVQVFKDNGIQARDLAAQAASERNMTEAERARAADAEGRRAAEMAKATAGLAEGLTHLAKGNLSVQLREPFAADFEGLRNDFNAAVTQLRDTLSSVVEAARSIDSGTSEIASGAADLSRRTEQQAASLEQTAAALDQITANVTSSSKMTEEARSVAQAANQSASHSAEVVSQAEDAMGRIEQSSQQISNIIGVIDEIAFQTNLLALNAGVEAARAGEAGKGFAVVAQEVRELAQRSAQAAKEIKGLIHNSTLEVETGVKLVRDTGEALKTIGDYIGGINRHMESIATSAREQSTGLAEVNTAVNQMDQTTQQNAAMVEESTAAAASLAQEAGRLRDLIAQFTLHHPSSQSEALRQTAAAMARPRSQASVVTSRSMPVRAARGGQAGLAVSSDGWESF